MLTTHELLQLQAVLVSSDDCVKIFDAHKCIYINPAGIREHFGKLKPKISCDVWVKSVVPAQRRAVKAALHRALKGKKGEMIVEHLPGRSTRRFCSILFLPVRQNGVKAALAISRDVSMLAQKEEELKQYRQAFDESPTPILFLQPDGAIIYCNRSANPIISTQRCIGKNFFSLVKNPAVRAFYQRVFRSKQQANAEFAHTTKKGELWHILHHITPVSTAQRIFFVVYLTDITLQKLAAERLLALSKFPEENPNPIWRIDSSKKILYRNQKAVELGRLPQKVLDNIMAVFSTKTTKHEEWTFGGLIYDLTAIYIAGVDYLNVYGRNITEERKLRADLLQGKRLCEQDVLKKTEELSKKIKELQLFQDSVISSELELKRLEEENAGLKRRDR